MRLHSDPIQAEISQDCIARTLLAVVNEDINGGLLFRKKYLGQRETSSCASLLELSIFDRLMDGSLIAPFLMKGHGASAEQRAHDLYSFFYMDVDAHASGPFSSLILVAARK